MLVLGFYSLIVVSCSFVGFHGLNTLRERQPIFIHPRRGSGGTGNVYVCYILYLVRCGRFPQTGWGSIRVVLAVIMLYRMFLLYFDVFYLGAGFL